MLVLTTTLDLRGNMGQNFVTVAKMEKSVTTRAERLDALSEAMDDWREHNRAVTKKVDVVQAVCEVRYSR
jgi:hypothetical protein